MHLLASVKSGSVSLGCGFGSSAHASSDAGGSLASGMSDVACKPVWLRTPCCFAVPSSGCEQPLCTFCSRNSRPCAETTTEQSCPAASRCVLSRLCHVAVFVTKTRGCTCTHLQALRGSDVGAVDATTACKAGQGKVRPIWWALI